MNTTPQSFVKAAIAAEREQWTGVDKLADAIDRDSYQLAVQQDGMSKATELANSLELIHRGKWCNDVELGAASELRRLHEINAELLEAIQEADRLTTLALIVLATATANAIGSAA